MVVKRKKCKHVDDKKLEKPQPKPFEGVICKEECKLIVSNTDSQYIKKEAKAANLSDLYALGGQRLHQTSRARGRQCHLKFLKDFKGTAYDDFNKFVVDRYLSFKRKNKPFPYHYTSRVIGTMQSYLKVRTYSKFHLRATVQSLNKIFNVENKDKIFFTPDNSKFDFTSLYNNITDDEKSLNLAKKRGKSAVRIVTDVYSDELIEKITTHYRLHLDNFLETANHNVPSKCDELAMLIVFLTFVPKRIREVLLLTMNKVNDLILRQETNIKSKSGTNIDGLVIPMNLARLLKRYILHKPGDTNSLFKFKYHHLYHIYKHALDETFGMGDMKRPFHGFRNHFAFKNTHTQNNAQIAREMLGHRRLKTTMSYARKQQKGQRALTEKLLLKQFLNSENADFGPKDPNHFVNCKRLQVKIANQT